MAFFTELWGSSIKSRNVSNKFLEISFTTKNLIFFAVFLENWKKAINIYTYIFNSAPEPGLDEVDEELEHCKFYQFDNEWN